MTEDEVLKYCYYYKGEKEPPFTSEIGSHERKLWVAERIVSQWLPRYDGDNPQEYMAIKVFCYVAKWDPYTFLEVMETYLKNCPEMRYIIDKLL